MFICNGARAPCTRLPCTRRHAVFSTPLCRIEHWRSFQCLSFSYTTITQHLGGWHAAPGGQGGCPFLLQRGRARLDCDEKHRMLLAECAVNSGRASLALHHAHHQATGCYIPHNFSCFHQKPASSTCNRTIDGPNITQQSQAALFLTQHAAENTVCF